MSTQTSTSQTPQISADKPIALVLGGTQGIGLALVANLLAGKDAKFIAADCLVVATARDPSSPHLVALQKDYPDRLFIEVVDVKDDDSIDAFIATMNSKYPRLDLYIHNAGVVVEDKANKAYVKIDKKEYMETHLVNVLAPQHVFHGLSPLLNKTHVLLGGKVGQRPKPLPNQRTVDETTRVRVVFMSSIMGSMEMHSFFLLPIYRSSKSALNHFVRDIAIRFPHLGSFVMHPGYVVTSLTDGSGEITPEQSAQGILTVISKDGYSVNSAKQILSYDGNHLPF